MAGQLRISLKNNGRAMPQYLKSTSPKPMNSRASSSPFARLQYKIPSSIHFTSPTRSTKTTYFQNYDDIALCPSFPKSLDSNTMSHSRTKIYTRRNNVRFFQKPKRHRPMSFLSQESDAVQTCLSREPKPNHDGKMSASFQIPSVLLDAKRVLREVWLVASCLCVSLSHERKKKPSNTPNDEIVGAISEFSRSPTHGCS